jgi:hypothetical protein
MPDNQGSIPFTPDYAHMSADAIALMQGDYEPQRVNNAVLYIEGLDQADQDLRLSLDTFPLPKQQNGIIEADYLNEKRKVAGKVTIDDMDIVFKDYVDAFTASILWGWRNQVYQPRTGKVGLARTYKKKGSIVLFAPNGTGQRMWEIHGMWPANMDPGEIDMAGEDIIKITMTIVCDKAIFTKPEAVDLTEGTD